GFNPQFGKKPQMVGFVQNGRLVKQTPDTQEQVRLSIPAMDDTLTFRLDGAFLDKVPSGNNPAKWTGLTNGATLDHAHGGGPVVLSRIVGPVVQIAPDTFQIRFNRISIPSDRRAGDIWLLAHHPGDDACRSIVQQAAMRIPTQLTEGAEQKITFPEISDVKLGIESLKLNAISDSGAPVFYYLREGPAEIDGDTLRFTKIPTSAKFPVRVTVVAWQWGRRSEPKLKSAEPVERTFFITR
ncbi:MAG TPA: hypothetical protein VK327_11805, partial [Candidatus Paceibacterota bacterium]|nr:hypothetical protein [Candidatus Paceibacterota bacterium]